MSFAAFLPPGFSPADTVALLAGLSAFVAVIALWRALLPEHPLSRRARAMAERRAALRAIQARPRRRGARLRGMGLMRRTILRLNLLKTRKATDFAERLARAGWRSTDALVVFLFFKVSLPFAAGAAAVLGLAPFALEPPAVIALASAAVLAGAFAPEVALKRASERRRHRIRLALPDALDLLVICAEAGLTLEAALLRSARELAEAAPDLAEEFGLSAVELGLLPERGRALANLVRRVDLAPVRAMVNTLAQAEKYGTPLAQSLRVLAAEFRSERLLRAEEKAARLPAVLTVPLILFILPALFVVLLGPAVIGAIDGLGGL